MGREYDTIALSDFFLIIGSGNELFVDSGHNYYKRLFYTFQNLHNSLNLRFQDHSSESFCASLYGKRAVIFQGLPRSEGSSFRDLIG